MTVQTYTGELVAQPARSALAAWVMDARDAMELADLLAETPFVPDSYRKTREVEVTRTGSGGRSYTAKVKEPIPGPEGVNKQTIAAAILYGHGIGFDPLQSLARVNIVKGKASLYAEAMQALLQAHGHRIEVDVQTDRECTVIARRAGSDKAQTFSWTIDRAAKAGYVQQNKKYETDPIAMLTARALAEACRRTAPGLLMGLVGTEEAEDWPTDDVVTVERADAPAPAAKRARAPRKDAPPPIEAPPLPDAGPPVVDDDDEPDEPAQEVEPVAPVAPAAAPAAAPKAQAPRPVWNPEGQCTPTQLGTIHGLLSNLPHLATTEDRAAYVQDIVGRETDGLRGLTEVEADLLLDDLKRQQP